MEEGYGCARGERAERDFARCGAGGVLNKLFALEAVEVADRGVGEFFAAVENIYFVHFSMLIFMTNFADVIRFRFVSAKLRRKYHRNKTLPESEALTYG